MDTLNESTIRSLLIIALITLPLKIAATWRAARNEQKVWFGLLFVLNSFGILELVYLFYLSKPKNKTD